MLRIPFLQFFRCIFVVFYLNLLGDIFYRWDGFKYYASFDEFIPSVALISILWSLVALLISAFFWLLTWILGLFCHVTRLKKRTDNLFIFIFFIVSVVLTIWNMEIHTLSGQASLNIKLILFSFSICIAILLSWIFRNKTQLIQESITPLVWLFGIIVVLSIPFVAYHTLLKSEKPEISKTIGRSFTSKIERPNIILITFDALTARDMSVYGYSRQTTPFISEWSKNATLFKRVQAESNGTTPSLASLMTGKRVWTHQAYFVEWSKPVNSYTENLPLLLKNSRYHTLAFIANKVASVEALGIDNSFDVAPPVFSQFKPVSLAGYIHEFLYRLFHGKIRLYDWILRYDFLFIRGLNMIRANVPMYDRTPEKAFNNFFAALDEKPQKPYFAWIHLFPPHFPYIPPIEFLGLFDSSAEMTDYKSQMDKWRYHRTRGTIWNIARARYDEYITYCDKQFRDFIFELRKRGELQDAVILLSSDHGESFEHDYPEHGGPHLYEQVTHIPLIIKEPNQERGRIVHNLVEQIDITSTILELANVPRPDWMEGNSVVPLLRDQILPRKTIFSMNLEINPSMGRKITKGTIVAWEGNYKLIHYLTDNKSLLFNLKEDPDELNNVFEQQPETGQRLLTIIKDNLALANKRISS